MSIEQFRVPAISCQHCVNAITKEVQAVKGVNLVQINLDDKSVRVEHDGSVQVAMLIGAINEAGFDEVAVLA